ncbi:hypothetical protein F9C11_32200 [Amycolatopsis sp. VS8301801F10]|uniref:hypothetical protein n=1 Tax=Amycolatopsis sp. VS8301801F10 TaxID=2652442 RepID=UPI0038FCAA4F
MRDFPAVSRHFGRAHNLGHDVLADHLAAHRGLLAAAARPGRDAALPDGPALFDRNRRKPEGAA